MTTPDVTAEVTEPTTETTNGEVTPEQAATFGKAWFAEQAALPGANPSYKFALAMIEPAIDRIESAQERLAYAGDKDALSVRLFKESDNPEHAEALARIAELQEAIDVTMAELAPVFEERDSLIESGASQFITKAAELASADVSGAAEDWRNARNELIGVLGIIYGKGNVSSALPFDIPSPKGSGSGGGTTGQRESGGWRPDLLVASVSFASQDGPFEDVTGTGKDGAITMADVAKAAGHTGTTASFSGPLREVNGGTELTTDNAGVTLATTTAKGNVWIHLVGKAKAA